MGIARRARIRRQDALPEGLCGSAAAKIIPELGLEDKAIPLVIIYPKECNQLT